MPQDNSNADTIHLQELDKHYIWHPFTPMQTWLDEPPLVIVKGQGCYLYDSQGNRYLDAVSSLWCNVHGHAHPHITAAIQQQAALLAHSTLLGLASQPSAELAQRLIHLAPASLARVFYSDSGATAVEIALKIAYQYWRNLDQPRTTFLALQNAYHGDTLGAVSVGGISIFHEIFGPLTFPSLLAPSPHPYRFDGSPDQCRDHCLDKMDRLLAQHPGQVAAIIVEPLVQGAAGILVHPAGFLAGVAQLAKKHDTLLIVDEVATGFGRTGKMFACEHENVEPDLLCLAKGITAGYLPLAATLASDNIFQAFLNEPYANTTFYHGHTYTGNALACAAALANLDVFQQENTLDHLPQKAAIIRRNLDQIAKIPHVGNVRQCGMMAAIELVADTDTKRNFPSEMRLGAKVCQQLRSRNILARPLGDVLVIMPPLATPDDDLQYLMTALQESLTHDLANLLQ